MNSAEREAIILDTAWLMIDGMVNWAMFVKSNRKEPTNLTFESDAHARLFLILLGDSLSEIRAFKGHPVPLGRQPVAERRETIRPHLPVPHASGMRQPPPTEGVNLPAINVVVDLPITGWRYLEMRADISKHSLARLETNVRHLQSLLDRAGRPVGDQEGYLAVKDFYE